MYPTISDLLNDLLGIYIPLPIQTFGFFMGLAFIGAYWATSSELQRKEKNGLLKSFTKTITLYKRATLQDYVIQLVFGALIGYKLLDIVFNYSDLLNDTQGFILSTRGNFIGALLGAGIAYYLLKKEDDKAKQHEPEQKQIQVQPHQLMGNILLIAAVTGLLGAKIFHNLENLSDFAQDPIGALLSFSGLTFYGGLIVASYAVLRYTGKNGINWKHMIDAAAPALILAYGIGRIGCQMSGDGDWGIVNLAPKPEWMAALPDWMWSFTYPHNVVGEGVPIPGCEGHHCSELPQPVYPTPFYEVLMSFTIFGILWAIRKSIHTPAMLFSIYLMFNGVERFLIEQIRVNTTYHIGSKFITQAEIISVALFVIGFAATLYLIVQNRKNTSQ
ncbi:MAG: prolipoprotein diacylglyceryl transferase family protein [Bacteroidota bacterium]